jgi:hypothetical protein
MSTAVRSAIHTQFETRDGMRLQFAESDQRRRTSLERRQTTILQPAVLDARRRDCGTLVSGHRAAQFCALALACSGTPPAICSLTTSCR